jgi:murein L,D-transpeptidase YcbB/YkuD
MAFTAGLAGSAAAAPLAPNQAALLRAALAEAPSHGLPAAAPGDEALETAAARYAQALRGGRLQALQYLPEWAQRPVAFDARAGLEQAIRDDRLAAWLADLAPPTPEYAQLKAALGRYRAIAAGGGWPSLASGPPPRLGAEDARAPALRLRLAVEDAATAPGEGSVFDEGLRDALVRFQSRHGLTADGVLGARTLAELNVTAEARVAQIEANMERRRWEARVRPATRIDVNIAAQRLTYLRDGAVALTMRTVVGRPTDRTPIFSDAVEAIVFNPPWNVPTTIATKEILPKLAKDPGYLARNRFVVQPGPGPVSQRLQQLPGPESALGLVKFDLPNSFAVYLHDTPAKSAFARDERALSHGCIRLEKPIELARLLLAGEAAWPPEAIQAALDGGATVRAPLSRAIPVSVGYWTVFMGDDGAINFRRDLYGWDARLTEALRPRP